MRELDNKVAEFCKKRNIRFTRYADDMVFSGDFDEKVVIDYIEEQIQSSPLRLNHDKTSIMKQNKPQIVTGVLVNNKIQLPAKERRMIRFEMHFIIKFGLAEHLQRTKNTRVNFLKHMEGKIAYGLYLNPDDQELKKYISFLKDLEKSF